jgi:choline dehydrogenase-like flavoprotein
MARQHDYVIVGAGSAGCVLANRLSEDPAVSVLLIEAGPPDTNPSIHVPAAVVSIGQTRYDWSYVTAPEPYMDGRFVFLPRGRTLGGSSSINAMVYIRGNRADYDEWLELGFDGWGWDDVLPYFVRAEDNERGASPLHGAGGPLSVSEGRSRHPLGTTWLEAAAQAGLRPNPDFNGEEQDGVGPYQMTQRGGFRCSVAVAYLHPVMDRPNLDVVTDALATEIVFKGSRAIGVEVERYGEVQRMEAGREVIIAAGAYNSPQLLMLSGIGPAPELAMLQIAPVADLPVGRNLQDHPMVLLNTLVNGESLLTEVFKPENAELLQTEGRGPLTSNLAEVGGFWRSRADLPAPDIQYHTIPVMFAEQGQVTPTDHAIASGPCLLKPRSRGSVTLRSADPTAKPRILHNYYADPDDMDAMVRGVRKSMEIMRQPAFDGVARGPVAPWPKSDEDADIREVVRRATQTTFHPVGTCAMGAVVDSELKVLGFEGLRVVDASVMPTLVRGNTNAPTVMIAERASDLILGKKPAAAAAVR